MSLLRRALAASLLLLIACAACGGGAEARARVVVFAAASLTAPFEVIAAAFERDHAPHGVDLHFAGTPQLVVQVREGARVDVFASADMANIQRLVDAGATAGPPVVFARNRLAIAVAKGNPKGITTLADLARDDLRVVLCGPEVPAGRYAREALTKAGVAVRSRSDEPSVKAVVAKLQLGEIDAGIVYATDVLAAKATVDGIAVDAAHDVVAEYPIAVMNAGRQRDAAVAFVAFVRSEAGRRILQSHGFELP